MKLCIDIGNSNTDFCIFDKFEKEVERRRFPSIAGRFAEELNSVLSQTSSLISVTVASVVTELNYIAVDICNEVLSFSPTFVTCDSACGLKFKYENPCELGADRIASSIGAISKYPNKNLIVFDFGTATTVCAISKNNEYLGGAIFPGLKTMAKSLNDYTSKLPLVEIEKPQTFVADGTYKGIQSGIFLASLGAVKEIIRMYKEEQFSNSSTLIIGTGGYSKIFKENRIFDVVEEDLVMRGVLEVSKI